MSPEIQITDWTSIKAYHACDITREHGNKLIILGFQFPEKSELSSHYTLHYLRSEAEGWRRRMCMIKKEDYIKILLRTCVHVRA